MQPVQPVVEEEKVSVEDLKPQPMLKKEPLPMLKNDSIPIHNKTIEKKI
jgi:hypothetical protein